MSIRVRYAPSPTGLQHIGGVRTALFNYLFARASAGTFVLRIEDTDRERYSEAALQDIYDTFDWLGLRWDEGPDVGGPFAPYFQSERIERYRRYAEELVESGYAYYAYDPPDEASYGKEGYDRRGRYLSPEQIEEYRRQGVVPVIRFKGPLEGATSFDDVLLGQVKRKNKDIIPDPVLVKSDGYPTYHMANVIDDHEMQITHILRAQEWVSSAPLHVLLYRAFGWEPPVYCHLPVVLGKDGQKLSKRHGATSVVEFRNQGYLPEALINYLARLGWSYDETSELFRPSDLERLFSLERLNKSPGVFDYKKLQWFNGVYIREKSHRELRELVLPFLQEAGLVSDPPTSGEEEILGGAIPLIQERLKTLSEAPDLVRFLFEEIEEYDIAEVIPKKMNAASTLDALRHARPLLEGVEERSDEENEELFRGRAEEIEMKLGNFLMPLRVAITGSRVSPPLFGSVRLLGTQGSLKRVDRVIELLENEVVHG